MTFWKRLTDCVSSHANSFLSKFEDPILKTEKAISLLEDLHQKSFNSLVEVKALVITTSDDIKRKELTIRDYERKVKDLLVRAKNQEIPEEPANVLATSMISTKLKVEKELDFLKKSLEKYTKLEDDLEIKVLKIKQQIASCKFQLTSLKSRMTVATTLKEIGKSISSSSDDSVVSLLEDSEIKVRNEEALATAYESMEEMSIEDQVDEMLGVSADAKVQEELDRLKAQI